MNEISVIVNQKPGEITWNFEEIKSWLEADLAERRNNVYTDETIKDAKVNIAELRKLITSITGRSKEIKKKCLEPYAVIEAQAKELISMIEEPIRLINEQVQDYEKRRKEAARAVIMAYWLQKSDILPEDIRNKAKDQIYDTRWENASASKKSWREGIDNGIQRILDEIDTIKSFNSEFEQDMMAVYKTDLSLRRAIAKMNEMKAQQERILELERKKKEALEEEKRREEEKRLHKAEESGRRQEALNQKKETADDALLQAESEDAGMQSASDHQDKSVTEQTGTGSSLMGQMAEGIDRGNFQRPVQNDAEGHPSMETRRIRIFGTERQITKILDYIRFTGADYEEE